MPMPSRMLFSIRKFLGMVELLNTRGRNPPHVGMMLGGVKAPTDVSGWPWHGQLAGTDAFKKPFTLKGGGCILVDVIQRERWRQPRKC